MTAPPRVAKNWTPEQKRRCVGAANAVLRETGDERKAIYACIHSAGKSKKVHQKFILMKQEPDEYIDEDEYEEAADDSMQYFQHLILLYYAGKITLAEFDRLFRIGIQDSFTRYMLLGLKGRVVTEKDLELLNKLLATRYDYFDNFMADLRAGILSEQMALWRAGLYGFSRSAYIGFTIPIDVALLMPILPGDDCEGGSANCGCYLTFDEDDENYYVTWNLDPIKEHCGLCMDHAMEFSPLVFNKAGL